MDSLQRVPDASRIDKPVNIAVLRGAQRLEPRLTPVEQAGWLFGVVKQKGLALRLERKACLRVFIEAQV